MAARLSDGLRRLGQDLAPDRRDRLVDYLGELHRWNRAYNLTAVTEPGEMVERHLIDSLSVRPFLTASRILDAGTGAGLPGLVLAIAEPQRTFELVDAGGKKVRFLRHVVRHLGLDNVEPVHGRLADLAPGPGSGPLPGEILARALAPLPRLVEWAAPWLDRGARLLAMKGRLEEAERSAVPRAYNVEPVPLDWPGCNAARCLAIVTRTDADPAHRRQGET